MLFLIFQLRALPILTSANIKKVGKAKHVGKGADMKSNSHDADVNVKRKNNDFSAVLTILLPQFSG
jgi:hypothetical protein